LIECASRFHWESDQDDSRRLLSVSVCELAKVFVFRQEYSCLRTRECEDAFILRAWADFSDSRDVVADGAKSPDDGEQLSSARNCTR
jgi:hypothetical protein